jgi:hypothetical protein
MLARQVLGQSVYLESWGFMIRKSLFWGLTLVLVVALVFLMVRGRRMEKKQSGRLVEAIQQSKSTPTRVLGPQDLEIIQSKMHLQGEAGATKPFLAAHHEIEIRNNGNVPYGEIQLRFAYLDRSGKVLITKTHSATQGILPGAILKLADIMVDGLPAATTSFRVTVAYADIRSN